ncbi:MAG: ATP-binding cassette domain-containing protein, partial [Paramuribaculum sp.]|nr:ATP-binding cassette domain-containing protein [Paramuribaculum sp.]
VKNIEKNPESKIGEFLSGKGEHRIRPSVPVNEIFDEGKIEISTDAIHTVKPLDVVIPKGRLTVVTGVSGSGKTTMVLESLVPALKASIEGKSMPEHVKSVDAPGIKHVKLIDSTPIGANVRSTVATYANIHDELRKIFSRGDTAKSLQLKAGDFSYNTGSLRCPVCDGTGSVGLDVQFLPDVDIPCPECKGSRYGKQAWAIKIPGTSGREISMPELMDDDVEEAIEECANHKNVYSRLKTLNNLGLGYLTLGEATPSLSGGEAQRLKLATEMGREQSDTLFVFDEPTIGLHPLDVIKLIEVFGKLIDLGATIVVIAHYLDLIRNADYIIDMGPGGGESGGKIVAVGTPEAVSKIPESITGRFIKSV